MGPNRNRTIKENASLMATANALRGNIDADDDRTGVLLHVTRHPLQ